MGVVIKQSIRGTIVNYIGACMGAIIVLFIYPLCLTPELIGLTRILTEFAVLFSFFAQAGLPNTLVRFFPSFQDEKTGHHHVFFWLMLIPAVGFVLFSLIFMLFKVPFLSYFSENSSLFTQYYYLGLPLALAWMYISVTEVISSVSLRIVYTKFTKEILVRLLTAICIVLYFFKILSFEAFLISFVGVYLINALANLLYIRSFFPIRLTPEKGFPDKALSSEIGRYMGYIVLVGLGSTLVTKIDTFMIGSMIGLSATGIYSIAFFMVAFLEIPYRSVFQISSPILSKDMKEGNYPAVNLLYKKITNNQLLISGLIFILLWVNLSNIYAIMPKGHLFAEGRWVVLFIGFTKMIDAVTGVNSYILSYSKYYRYSLWLIFLLGIFTVVGNLLLIPRFGITGAAIGALISFSLYNFIVVAVVWKKLDLQPFQKSNFIGLGILVLVLLAGLLLPSIVNPYFDAFLRSALVVVVFGILLYIAKPSKEIDQLVLKGKILVKEKFNL
jgi:O-antigen/teichoic acid export membrane protein